MTGLVLLAGGDGGCDADAGRMGPLMDMCRRGAPSTTPELRRSSSADCVCGRGSVLMRGGSGGGDGSRGGSKGASGACRAWRYAEIRKLETLHCQQDAEAVYCKENSPAPTPGRTVS